MAYSDYRAQLRQPNRSAPLATPFQPLDLSVRQLRHVAPGFMQYNCAMQQPNYVISAEQLQFAQFREQVTHNLVQEYEQVHHNAEQVRHNVELEHEQVRHNVELERRMDRSASQTCTDVICSPSSYCFIFIIFLILSLIFFSFLFRYLKN